MCLAHALILKLLVGCISNAFQKVNLAVNSISDIKYVCGLNTGHVCFFAAPAAVGCIKQFN